MMVMMVVMVMLMVTTTMMMMVTVLGRLRTMTMPTTIVAIISAARVGMLNLRYLLSKRQPTAECS